MTTYLRLLPYVWPHRRKLFISLFFALLVAMFWGLNLSVAFPVVKVLLEKQDLRQYIQTEIEKIEKEINEKSKAVQLYDGKLHALEKSKPNDLAQQVPELQRQRSRAALKLGESSRRLTMLNWVNKRVIPYLPKDKFDVLAAILAVLMLATFLKGVCIFIQESLIGSVVELTAMDVRKHCFRCALDLDYQTLSIKGTPVLMSRFTYDMNLMTQGLTLFGGKAIREPLKAIVCTVLAFWVCWQLTLMALVFAPLVGFVFYRIGNKLKQASHRVMESMSRIYKTLEETFESMKVVIAFNGARAHRQRFHRENKHYYAKAMKIVRIDAMTSPTIEVLAFIVALCALLPGCYLVLRNTTEIWGIRLSTGQLEITDLALMYVFLAGIIDPARKLSTTYSKLKRATAAADRIFAFADTQTLVKQPARPKALPRPSQSIVFKKVDFSYMGRADDGTTRPAVLEEVSLRVNAGEVIVVVGENGSGKSTLVNLLPRYFDPTGGSVMIDDVDIRDVRLRDLRSNIGIVTQETLLFDDSIYENIRYGKRSATREEVEAAARKANVTQFVELLPDGFETNVGERGQRLSGGQRQRVALARAILRDPAILILDEATSAIDKQSELLIHQTLRAFAQGRTTFIITHAVSPSILDFVSRIVVMDQGRLIAAASHETLIQTCAVYQKLFRAQPRHREAAA